MDYLHIEVDAKQVSKNPIKPCGDVFSVTRNDSSTLVILSDGIGSGVKANIAATMCVSRLQELINRGFSMRAAVSSVVRTMMDAIEKDLPYAVFSVLRIQSDGYASILSYDMPEPIYITKGYSTILSQRKYNENNAIIAEANCYLKKREAILLMSDGITQSGMGFNYNLGWGIENVNKYIKNLLNKNTVPSEIPALLYRNAFEINGRKNYDDSSVVLASTRLGVVVNVLAGPPLLQERNHEVVSYFINQRGLKIVSGATTARIVADELGRVVKIDDSCSDGVTPPASKIEGINLVTEGLVTLNQLFNVLDEDREKMDDDNPVTKLYDFLMLADKVNFFVGLAQNPANSNISYKQRGLIPRKKIISMIAEKLRENGKLVVINEI